MKRLLRCVYFAGVSARFVVVRPLGAPAHPKAPATTQMDTVTAGGGWRDLLRNVVRNQVNLAVINQVAVAVLIALCVFHWGDVIALSDSAAADAAQIGWSNN